MADNTDLHLPPDTSREEFAAEIQKSLAHVPTAIRKWNKFYVENPDLLDIESGRLTYVDVDLAEIDIG